MNEQPVSPASAAATAPGWSDRRRVGCILLLTLFVHAFIVLNTTVVSRDCIIFARYALHLETSPRDRFDPNKHLVAPWEVIKQAEHPPGYPAAVLAMSWLVRPLMGGVTPQSMALSAQLVSVLAAVLLVFPMFSLVRRLFDSRVAFAATALFQVLPVFAEVTSDGISDGLYLWTVVLALWFGTRALEKGFAWQAYASGWGAGLCVGLGYLVRPDALIVGLAVGLTYAGAVVAWLWRSAERRQAWGPFVAGVGLVLGVALFVAPYVLFIGKLTNKPSGQEMLQRVSGGDAKPTYFDRNSRMKTVNVPLGAWWDPQAFAGQSQQVWAAKELFFKEYPKAAHYALPLFALIGVLALRRRLQDARLAMLVLLVAIHMSVLWLLASKIGYVSQRHTLMTVFVTTIFGAASFPIIGRWLLRGRPGNEWRGGMVCVLLILLTAMPRNARSLHAERAAHKAAGIWLAEHADPTIPIVDPYGWTEYFAGRTLHDWSRSSAYHNGPWVYAVVEPTSKSPHSRLPLFEPTQALLKQGEVIYQYPAEGPLESAKVVVVRAKPLKWTPPK